MDATTKISLASIACLSIVGAVICALFDAPEGMIPLFGIASGASGALAGISMQSKVETKQ